MGRGFDSPHLQECSGLDASREHCWRCSEPLVALQDLARPVDGVAISLGRTSLAASPSNCDALRMSVTGTPWHRMTSLQRSVIAVAVLGLLAVTIAVGTGAATGAAARALGVIQGLLLIAASLTLLWRRHSETRVQQSATPQRAAEDTQLTGLASTILDAESQPAPRN